SGSIPLVPTKRTAGCREDAGRRRFRRVLVAASRRSSLAGKRVVLELGQLRGACTPSSHVLLVRKHLVISTDHLSSRAASWASMLVWPNLMIRAATTSHVTAVSGFAVRFGEGSGGRAVSSMASNRASSPSFAKATAACRGNALDGFRAAAMCRSRAVRSERAG